MAVPQVVSVQSSTGIYINGILLVPKFKLLNHSTVGDNEVVAAVTGKKIRVTNIVLVAAGTVTVRFESGASGTALTGQIPLIAQTGFAAGFDPTGHFETAAATALNLELSAGVAVHGWLKYVEVD
jgi:hypothetical protein